MKNNQSLLNLRRHATRLFAFLFLTLLGTGQMWGDNVTFTAADIAKTDGSTEKSGITMTCNGTQSVSNRNFYMDGSTTKKKTASGLSSSADSSPDTKYIEIKGNNITSLDIDVAGNSSGTDAQFAVVFWNGNYSTTYTSYVVASMLAYDHRIETTAPTHVEVPSGTTTIRIYRRVKITESTKTLGSGTNVPSSAVTSNIASIVVNYIAGSVSVTGVSLNETAISLEEGANETLTATVTPSNATNQAVTWSSSDEDVATVENGVVTAVSQGNATITVTTTDGSKTATCDVTVTAPATKSAIVYANTKGASTAALPTQYSEGMGVASFAAIADVDGFHFTGWNPSSISAEATGEQTITAQWVPVVEKVIYSYADGIGSQEVTNATASISEGLILSNTAGRIKLTAAAGNQFKNGDKIYFAGTVGNTEKDFGIKYGPTTSLGTDVHVAGTTTPLEYRGTLTLSAATEELYIGRSGGTTTTLTSCIITTQVGLESEAFADVIKVNGENATYNAEENVLTVEGAVVSAPTVVAVNHQEYSDGSNADVNIEVEMQEDGAFYVGTFTIGSTEYTVKVPVDNTVTVYFHYVEDFNGESSPWVGYGETWSELSETETIGGAKWYKYTKNLDNVIVSYRVNEEDKRTQTLNISELSGEDNYYVIYNSWFEETSNDWRMRATKVANPTRKTINVYLQNPGWHEGVNNFKMWVEDGINGANVYGTTADYEFTSHVTYGGKTWYNATLHYFGDACTIYPKFMENTVQWEASAGIAGNTANVYIYYNGWNENVDETHKTFVAGVSTSMLYAEDSNVAQADVTEATTWDWTKASASSSIELGDNTIPSRSEEFGLANVAGINNNANFNAAALTMVAQFPTRDKKYAQATSVKFHTTVPGMVTVVFSNTGSDRPNRYLHVNGVSTGVGSNASSEKHKTATAFVGAGDVLINAYFNESDFTDGSFTTNGKTTSYDANNQMLRIYSITFTPGYSRSVSAGFGTICLPYAVAELPEGYTFYDVTGVLGTETVTGIEVDEVTALVAGKPYVFDAAEAGTLTLECTGDAAAVQNTDYLTGNLTATTMDVPQGSYLILKTDNKLHKIAFDGAVIQPNKAYFTLTPNGNHTPAPGRRVIYVADATDTATGLDNLNAAEQVKFMQDGHIYIRVADRIYDATGRLVK